MPPVAIAAGVAAGGSILGGVISSNANKKVAQTQQQIANENTARLQQNQAQITAMSQPTIDRGESAAGLVGNFLGTSGGTAAADALATYRGSTGYTDLVKEGLGAVNANAYAKGAGDSGAALKALQTRGASLADRSSGDWLSRLGSLASLGVQAQGNVAGVSTNTTNAINQTQQNSADASSNATLASSTAWQKALQGALNSGASALGSSFGSGTSNTVGQAWGTTPNLGGVWQAPSTINNYSGYGLDPRYA